MHRDDCILYFLVLTLAGLGACSSKPSGKEPQKTAVKLEKIRGKAQLIFTETSATDTALNAGGPSVYLRDGVKRYRLFLNKPFELQADKEYVAEGINAQKVIDDIGDPDQGKNGYPLQSSCDRVIAMAWPGLAMDLTESQSSSLCGRVKRYPARPVFLVTSIEPAAPEKGGAAKPDEEKELPVVSVPADKQRALLIEGPAVLPAPLWEPEGGTTSCKVFITDGKVSELDTGAQLCESVPWSQFRYQPTLKSGHPVKVKTEIEIKFEPHK